MGAPPFDRVGGAVVDSPAHLSECDLIVIATPVQLVPGVIAQLSGAKVAGLVTDICSTKRTVMSAAQSASALLFVGVHPVAAIAAKLPTSSSALTDAPAVRDLFERAKALKSNQ